MPELPEVETNRRGLAQCVTGLTIDQVDIYWPRIVKTEMDLLKWSQELQGRTIERMDRRAKYLIFVLSQGLALVSHLRMEGKYFYYPVDQIPEVKGKHVHLIMTFTDGSQLQYQDVRKFGRFELMPQTELADYFKAKKIGPEPTPESFKLDGFYAGLGKISRAIKPALLDQKLVAGLGNIYVDEALFQAQIHPLTPAKDLSYDQASRLHAAIIDVLARAVEAGGTTIRTYLNSLGEAGSFQVQLAVYGQTGQPCPRCGHPVEKMVVGQRGTHYCPICQPLYEV